MTKEKKQRVNRNDNNALIKDSNQNPNNEAMKRKALFK